MLHNGLVVVDADTKSWVEGPLDQSRYVLSLIRKPLSTIERRSGGHFRVHAETDSIVFARPGEIEEIYHGTSNQRVNLIGLLFSPDLTKNLFDDMHLGGVRDIVDPVAASLITASTHLRASSDPLFVDHLTMAILHRMRGLRPSSPSKSKGRIERVLAYIDERIASKLTLTELAGAAFMSPFHFVRTFKHTTGMTPLAYVTNRRIDRAKELVATTSHTLGEIALMCGFSSQSQLNNAFRRIVGTTPTEFRRKAMI